MNVLNIVRNQIKKKEAIQAARLAVTKSNKCYVRN